MLFREYNLVGADVWLLGDDEKVDKVKDDVRGSRGRVDPLPGTPWVLSTCVAHDGICFSHVWSTTWSTAQWMKSTQRLRFPTKLLPRAILPVPRAGLERETVFQNAQLSFGRSVVSVVNLVWGP